MLSKYALFQEIWLSNPDYKDWLQNDNYDKDTVCKIWCKTFSISAMEENFFFFFFFFFLYIKEETAIKSHAKGMIHLFRKPNSSGIASFFSKIKKILSMNCPPQVSFLVTQIRPEE